MKLFITNFSMFFSKVQKCKIPFFLFTIIYKLSTINNPRQYGAVHTYKPLNKISILQEIRGKNLIVSNYHPKRVAKKSPQLEII